MATLEDTVKLIIKDFIANEVLFTALDVSNAVKQTIPTAKHRNVREVVRSLFSTDIEPMDYIRTPINVQLADGTTVYALLYHNLSDSWDLDNKYGAQQRSQKAARPSTATVTVSPTNVVVTAPVTTVSAPAVTSTSTMGGHAPTVPAPFTTARAQWEGLFNTQPSLFPTK